MAQIHAVYEKLCPSRNEIRLLRILPASTLTTLNCELRTHQLGTTEEDNYTALSYVWGSPAPVDGCTIVVNGQTTHITPNLLSALQSLYNGGIGDLWVDAICINQSDLEEKQYQVSMMAEVYSRASRTVIWLGLATEDSDLAMETVAQVKPGDLSAAQFDDEMDRRLRAVTQLLRRPWWTRIWVLQEAFLSKKPIARCGSREIPFEAFVAFKGACDKSHWHTHDKWRPYQLFDSVPFTPCLSNWHATKKELASSDGGASLFAWIVSMSGKFEATEVRDKIYALLAMSLSEDRKAIAPDYQRPLREVLIDVALRGSEFWGLPFLSFVEAEDNKPAELKLPSWVPYLLSGDSTQHLIGYKPNFQSNISAIAPEWATLFKRSDMPPDEADAVSTYSREKEVFLIWGTLCDMVAYSDPMPYVPQHHRTEDSAAASKLKAQRARLTIETIRSKGERPLPLDFGDRYDALLGERPHPCPPVCEGAGEVVPDCNERQEAGGTEAEGIELFDDWVREYAVPVISKGVNKSFIMTRKGRMGMAVRGVQQGDVVIAARGANVPLVVRKRSDWGSTFVGEAYIPTNGFMHSGGTL
ncbi:HET-domain-containing protein [Thozetella sp. PMI_491]|nr:HET-domain-containing protein [Thozetella sp. PMI_491]